MAFAGVVVIEIWAGALRHPPGLLFHGSLGLFLLSLLYSVSVPGIDFFPFVEGMCGLAGCAVIWLARALAFAV